MILVLVVGQSVPLTWYKIRPITLPLHHLRAVLPFWDAEMPLLNNPVADDLESDLGFVCNCGRMSAFEREYYRLNNIMPKRPLSAICAVNQTSENEVKDIFQDLHNIGIHTHGVSCLQRVSNDRFCITFGKENYRKTFLKKFSFIPHFTNSRPQLSTSSNLVYVTAYDRPICKPVPPFCVWGLPCPLEAQKSDSHPS